MSTLQELVQNMDHLPDDGVIYAVGSFAEWTPETAAIVEVIGEYEEPPTHVGQHKYFLECNLAKELLADAKRAWRREGNGSLSIGQLARLVIHYAAHDTLPGMTEW